MKIKFFGLFLFITFTSCQEVTIEENEIGIYFEKFGGGVDTTKVYQSGSYNVPNWNYFITYEKGSIKGEFTDFAEVFGSIEYEYKLIERDANKYHYFIGGDPALRVNKSIEQEVYKLDSATVNDNSDILQDILYKKCRSKLLKEYIDLQYLVIN